EADALLEEADALLVEADALLVEEADALLVEADALLVEAPAAPPKSRRPRSKKRATPSVDVDDLDALLSEG
ncbi:MAG: hypothetical protein JXX28_09610, partial [Deltaproteobacteria bacterium]|nr:hypothetical protein [Deltaproteobacteria bacterium]